MHVLTGRQPARRGQGKAGWKHGTHTSSQFHTTKVNLCQKEKVTYRT